VEKGWQHFHAFIKQRRIGDRQHSSGDCPDKWAREVAACVGIASRSSRRSDLWKSTYLGTGQSRQRIISTATADAAIIPTRHSLFASDLLALHWKPIYHDDRATVMVPP
jgi:hypothetical protein